MTRMIAKRNGRSFCLLVCFSLATFGNSTVFAQRGEIPFINYKLRNGLDVILAQDRSAPTVSINLWYDVGSRNERPGQIGMAHLFEHMMFRGSKNLPKGEFKRLIQEAGGSANASEEDDFTEYFETLPSNRLNVGLWLESERMRAIALDAETFKAEREVVKEEFLLKRANVPYGISRLLSSFDAVYNRATCYAWSDQSNFSLNTVRLDALQWFFDTYYKPNNATLAVVGDMDIPQTKAMIQKYFGDIPRGTTAPPPVQCSEPFAHLPVRQVVKDKYAKLLAIGISYGTVKSTDPDWAAIKLLASILGVGDSSRLYQRLVKQEQVTTNVLIDSWARRDPAPIQIFAVANSGISTERLDALVTEEIARVQKEGVTNEELKRAKNRSKTSRVLGRFDPYGKARALLEGKFYGGDPSDAEKEIHRYEAVTPADIQRVAVKYFIPQNRAVVITEPTDDTTSSTTSSPAQPDERTDSTNSPKASTPVARPPAPMPSRPFKLPRFQETALKNGLRVIVVENHSQPVVTVNLAVKLGLSAMPKEKAGILNRMVNLLTKGTSKRSAQQISETIEGIGTTITPVLAQDYMGLSTTLLSDHLSLGMDLIGDSIMDARFDGKELELLRQRQLNGFRLSLGNPQGLAGRQFAQRVFGTDHPYGRIPSLATIQGITRDDLVKLHSAYFKPENAVLVVTGDVNARQLETMAAKYFGDWKSQPAPSDTFGPTPTQKGMSIHLVDRPGSEQSTIIVGHPGIGSDNPDLFALEVLNHIVGQATNSRLSIIRQEKGWTYGISSVFSKNRDRGSFQVNTSVRKEVTGDTVAEILNQLRLLNEKPVTPAEVNSAKNYLIDSYGFRISTPKQIADQLTQIKMLGLPADYLSNYRERIRSVSLKDVQDAANRYISPDKAVIVIVGDASQILAAIEKIAPVTIYDSTGAVKK